MQRPLSHWESFWFMICAALLFLLITSWLLMADSFGASVLFCNESGHTSGDGGSTCPGSQNMESSFLGDNAFVFVCQEGQTDCYYWTDNVILLKVSELGPGDRVLWQGGWISPEELFWGGGIGGGSGSSSSFSSSSSVPAESNPLGIPVLTWSQWGELITAIGLMFTIVGVIRFVRKNQ